MLALFKPDILKLWENQTVRWSSFHQMFSNYIKKESHNGNTLQGFPYWGGMGGVPPTSQKFAYPHFHPPTKG